MMISQKNERIVDLCIWVDENAYKEDVDKEKLYDSLYRIVSVLAIKHKLLPNWEDYQPFSLYAASRLYLRLTNPKQFKVNKDGKKMKKIKSILNFIKKTMHPMIVDFQNQTFEQNFVPGLHGDTVETIRYRTIQKARDQFSSWLRVDFEYYLDKICTTIKEFLNKSPYVSNRLEYNNIYKSCLLTLLNQVTLSNENKDRLHKRMQKGFKTDDFINSIYKEELKDSVILYHLNSSMYNYIATVVNVIRKLIVNDLKMLIGDNEPTESVIKSIMSVQTEETVNYVEE